LNSTNFGLTTKNW